MDSYSDWILYLAIPLLLLSFLFRRRKLSYPPGPKGIPVVGNMGLVNQLSHRGLAELAKKYGGLFYLRIGRLHMVTISSPEIARQVLQVQDATFANKPATIAVKYLSYDRADMAFAHYGPFWRQMRKLCVMKLFSRKRAESWESVRDEVDSLVRAVASKAGSSINIGEMVFELTRNIIYRAAFGSSCGQDEFVGIIQEFSILFGAFNLADFFPGLGWIDPQGINARLVKARDSLDVFIDKIIDDHIEKRRGSNRCDDREKDMVDELLAFYGEESKVNESEDLQNSIKLTRDNIKALIMDVMFGGTETVASAIEWAMAQLMGSPDDLRKVQQELDDVVGRNRQVQETDFDKLTYIKCTLKETLRLHPPIPLLLHETTTDTVLEGYHIPVGSRVVVNAWAIGRDPKYWEDSETFKPSRFLEENVADFKGSDFEYLPFGSGRRSCPGMQLGLYALEMAVSHLLHNFSWELPNGMKPIELDMDDMLGLTAPRANRLYAVPTSRLSSSIY